MLSRPILKDIDELHVYIDSESFEDLLDRGNKIALAILHYFDSNYLDVVRNPYESKHDELKKVVEYKLQYKGSELDTIEVVKPTCHYIDGFSYKMQDVLDIAKMIYEKEKISQDELNPIINVFIQAVFNRFEKSNIYVTQNKLLLKKRLWFECHFPSGYLNIMTVQEASVFIDLFFKHKGHHYYGNCVTVNKGYWYFLGMRLLLPHYNAGDNYLDALSHRVYYTLMALDEMAVQFYSGVNNDTMDLTLYHFNYFVGLITGIFDNLALKTNVQLKINFSHKSRISLQNINGKDFLVEVREKNPKLREHINSCVEFIRAIFLLREQIIHKDLLKNVSFENRDDGNKWKANFVRVSKEFIEFLEKIGDKPSEYDPFSIWGIYKLYDVDILLEPYQFSITTIEVLSKFVDKYLELLGYPLFNRRTQRFAEVMNRYEQFRLGYRWEDR